MDLERMGLKGKLVFLYLKGGQMLYGTVGVIGQGMLSMTNEGSDFFVKTAEIAAVRVPNPEGTA